MKTIKYRRDLWHLLLETPGNAAELGVAEGLFSRDMLEWPIHFPKVYLVDRWTCVPSKKGDSASPQLWHDCNLANARKLMAPFGERAVFLRGDTVAMARHVPAASLALINVDADHSEEGVWRDIVSWYPKLVPGGIMAFHDYLNPGYGVNKAVKNYATLHQLRIHEMLEDDLLHAGAYFYADPF